MINNNKNIDKNKYMSKYVNAARDMRTLNSSWPSETFDTTSASQICQEMRDNSFRKREAQASKQKQKQMQQSTCPFCIYTFRFMYLQIACWQMFAREFIGGQGERKGILSLEIAFIGDLRVVIVVYKYKQYILSLEITFQETKRCTQCSSDSYVQVKAVYCIHGNCLRGETKRCNQCSSDRSVQVKVVFCIPGD